MSFWGGFVEGFATTAKEDEDDALSFFQKLAEED